LSINRSLHEWGAQPATNRYHSEFSRKLISQAIDDSQMVCNDPIVLNDLPKIPKDRDKAIQMLFVLELQEYHDEELFEELSMVEEDALENLLTEADNYNSIIFVAPFFQVSNYNSKTEYEKKTAFARFQVSECKSKTEYQKKAAFARFRVSDLDPFRRFSEGREEGLSKAQVAFENCSIEGWINGYAFEAIVASHAVHSESCFRCKRRNSIYWSGGSGTSWRDIYCQSCKSCFEIKSKKDKESIDRIYQYKRLYGGSFKGWCKENFFDRDEGSDFIVLVSRKPSFFKDKWFWIVEVAEIERIEPRATQSSFISAHEERIPIKTEVSIKNPHPWFQIPIGTKPNLQEIFQQSFEEVFPGLWNEVAKIDKTVLEEALPQNEEVTKIDFKDNIDELRTSLAAMTVENWEDFNLDQA
jgi:hypothetical protein